MAQFLPRSLATELRKHFHGTAGERILTAVRLGQQALDLYLATLPPGTSRADARRTMQRRTHRGRQPSAVMDAYP
jgi:hypothetical protein